MTDPYRGSCLCGAVTFEIDEFLPAAGVRDDDWFWIVIKGQTNVQSNEVSSSDNNIAIGDLLAASAHGTTAGTTGGHLLPFTLEGATVSDTAMLNKIGRALGANTTGATRNNYLVKVDIWPSA